MIGSRVGEAIYDNCSNISNELELFGGSSSGAVSERQVPSVFLANLSIVAAGSKRTI